jgi:hypothetical protein
VIECHYCGQRYNEKGGHVNSSSCRRNAELRDIARRGLIPLHGIPFRYSIRGWPRYPIRPTALFTLRLFNLPHVEVPSVKVNPWLCAPPEAAGIVEMVHMVACLSHVNGRGAARAMVLHQDALTEFSALVRLGCEDHRVLRQVLAPAMGACLCLQCADPDTVHLRRRAAKARRVA